MTEIARGSLDDRMLALADRCSPEEISEALGHAVSPAAIHRRIRELLAARDWLSEAEQDKLITLKMKRILGELEGRFLDLDNAKVQLQLLRAIGERLDKRREATEVDLNSYSANVGRQLGHVVDLALTYMKGALREEVDSDKWDALVADALSMAWVEIEKKQIAE